MNRKQKIVFMSCLYYPQISVDCVVFGYDERQLKVLVVKKDVDNPSVAVNNVKLPGSIIKSEEDLDSAATRILEEYTGLSKIYLRQFKAFGNPVRSSDADVLWTQKVVSLGITRLVTVGYVALIKLGKKVSLKSSDGMYAEWVDVSECKKLHLAFDHKDIIRDALENIKMMIKSEPHLLFELVPKKFTLLQVRALYDSIYEKKSDAANFRKFIFSIPGVAALPEVESGVPHRAARFFTYIKPKR